MGSKKHSLSPENGRSSSYRYLIALFGFTVISVFLSSSYAGKQAKLTSSQFKPPEKIVLGGEATGKIALIKNGKLTHARHIEKAVFHQVMFSKDGRYVFAAASNLNKVYVFDGETLEPITSIEVGKHPSHMDIDDGGEIISVVNEDSNDVSFISVSELKEIARVSGDMSVPHFARYHNGFWFVANFGAPKISVVSVSKSASRVVTEIVFNELPPCPDENRECAFFDVSIRKDIGQGLASHTQTGAIVDFDANDLKKNKVITRIHPKLSYAYHRDNIEAYKALLSPFDSVGWIIFRGGVVGYDFVAREVSFVWKSESEFFSQLGIEYPGKVFVLFQKELEKHAREKIQLLAHRGQRNIHPNHRGRTNLGVAILNKFGRLEKIVDVGGIPGEGVYYNGYVYVFVLKENKMGKVESVDIIALDGAGRIHKVAETDFEAAEGIHIPGAYPHCH